MTQEIAYGSLCTGYDGIGKALRLAGLPIVARFHAESEPSVADVLQHESPDVPNVGDIKTVPWGRAPHIDILSSGDPCQSISIAGRKLGREDARFLWPWVREAYREMRPGAIFFENVANIASHDGGRTMAERFAHLLEDGYEVRWTILGACAVGAPHHRHRWYAVAAYRGAAARPARRVGEKAICGAPRSGGRFLLPTPLVRDADRTNEGDETYWSKRAQTPPLGAVVGMLPTPDASLATRGGLLSPAAAVARSLDRRRSTNLDDAVAALLPTPAAADERRGGEPVRISRTGTGPTLADAMFLLPTPVAVPYGTNRGGSAGRGEDQPARPSLDTLGTDPAQWGRYADAVALWEHVTGVPAPAPTELAPKGGQRLSPALPEWMMGLAPGTLTDRLDRRDALRAAGNGVVPQAAAAAWRLLTGKL